MTEPFGLPDPNPGTINLPGSIKTLIGAGNYKVRIMVREKTNETLDADPRDPSRNRNGYG